VREAKCWCETRRDVLKFVYESFDKTNILAGAKWYFGPIIRHPKHKLVWILIK
jgi:hypothetical protein